MEPREPSPEALLEKLQRKQSKHLAMLRRVEKAAARLGRRKQKLHALELEISTLEQRAAGKGSLREALLIFNPSAGAGENENASRLAEIVTGLRAHGIAPRIGVKTSGKTARALAREAVKTGESLVLVAAGDGTIEAVASELVGSGTQLGIVPIGTMNNLARSLGVPLDIDGACALIAAGTTRNIDIGRVHSNDSPHEEYFLECAGVGLSAIGMLAGQPFHKRRWAAFPRALRRFFESRPGTMRVEMDGLMVEPSTRVVTVSNSPFLGKTLLAAPEAKMDDGLLDVCLYDGMGDTALAAHFLTASSQIPHEAKMYRAKSVRIVAEEHLTSNSDVGIATARNLVQISIVPAALPIIVGNGVGLSLPVETLPGGAALAQPSSNGNSNHEIRDPAPAQA